MYKRQADGAGSDDCAALWRAILCAALARNPLFGPQQQGSRQPPGRLSGMAFCRLDAFTPAAVRIAPPRVGRISIQRAGPSGQPAGCPMVFCLEFIGFGRDASCDGSGQAGLATVLEPLLSGRSPDQNNECGGGQSAVCRTLRAAPPRATFAGPPCSEYAAVCLRARHIVLQSRGSWPSLDARAPPCSALRIATMNLGKISVQRASL